ncbi:hypothetical protein C8J57DRAFT_1393519 [Mycena rebaudengoi]|nr:hypothetical protein C8J57DRAFT_1393519 [Mycena rebaudengoi]
MPHKKAKRSIREQQRSAQGADLAPSNRGGGDALSNEPLPKSFVRALGAAQVRAEYHAKKKRKLPGDGDDDDLGGQKAKKKRRVDGGGDPTSTRILPGETLAHFNKRVETNMRPLVRSAVQSSLATERAQRKKPNTTAAQPPANAKTNANSKSSSAPPNSKSKSKLPVDAEEDAPPQDKHASRPKEFARTSSSTPRRLNDVAMAPPDLSASTRRAVAQLGQKSKSGEGKSSKASILSPAQRLHMEAERAGVIARYRALKVARRAAAGGGWVDGGERGGGEVLAGEEE